MILDIEKNITTLGEQSQSRIVINYFYDEHLNIFTGGCISMELLLPLLWKWNYEVTVFPVGSGKTGTVCSAYHHGLPKAGSLN